MFGPHILRTPSIYSPADSFPQHLFVGLLSFIPECNTLQGGKSHFDPPRGTEAIVIVIIIIIYSPQREK